MRFVTLARCRSLSSPTNSPSVMLYFFKISRMLTWSSNGQSSLPCRNIHDNAARE